MAGTNIAQLQACLDRLKQGDPKAQEEIVTLACQQLQRMTRRMLNKYPELRRWEDTDDVFQGAIARLCKALQTVVPENPRHFLNLAGQQIRRQLIDLARYYFRSTGLAVRHATPPKALTGTTPPADPANETDDPAQLASWTELHEYIDTLPEKEREVFNLLWYHDLTQKEAAEILEVAERTVVRRWQSARLKLIAKLQSEPPEL